MKLFAIRDEEVRPRRDLAYLFYFEKKKEFTIELSADTDPWDLPMILFNFARKGIYTLDTEWSRIWVEQRIVPRDRQNLGQILRDNGMTQYDEYRLLLLNHGRCAQDSCYIAETDETKLPQDIAVRKSFKIRSVFPLNRAQMLVFFHDGTTKLCDIPVIAETSPACHRLRAWHDRLQEFHVLAGGYGIGWNGSNGDSNEEKISDKALYDKGMLLPFSLDDFRTSLGEQLIDTQEAAGILDCTRQNINLMVQKGLLKPVRQSDKNTLFLRSDLLEQRSAELD